MGDILEKPDLVIFGFSGNAREAFDTIDGLFRIRAFLDDRADLQGTSFARIPVLPSAQLADFPDAQVICLIGSEHSFRQRAAIIARLGLPPARFATVISPQASVSRQAEIGPGVLLFPGVRIMANVMLGSHVAVLPNSVIHHDSRIGECSLIGSSVVVAGNVTVENSCYIGSGSTIRNGCRLGTGSLIGLGSNVLRDVGPGQVMVGNPARVLRPGP